MPGPQKFVNNSLLWLLLYVSRATLSDSLLFLGFLVVATWRDAVFSAFHVLFVKTCRVLRTACFASTLPVM